jgi:acyl-coenzyme A thioesterase PaaI-like protein
MNEPCLQERYAPHNACFGCGPSNEKGLRIRSFPQGERVVADWQPEPHHEAFPGVINGGIIGSLLDCHMNWTAAWHLMQSQDLDKPPCTVTMEYAVKLRRPTPSDGPLHLEAWVTDTDEKGIVSVEAELSADGEVCDRATGRFVAVKPGHPAYHRW